MTTWTLWDTLHLAAVGKRLAALLVAVSIYYVAVALVVRFAHIVGFEWGSGATLINTAILGLLMSFRNRVAYDRWWSARGLWGQLTNDSRNLAAKLAAFVPAEVLAQSRVAEVLSGFAEALKRHLREQRFQLRDLPGFENSAAAPPHIPLYLSQRLFDIVASWKRDAIIDRSELWILDKHMTGLLDVCGACEKIKFTPLAPSYKSLLRTGLFLNALADPWLTTPEIGLWGLPIFLLACFFLFGVELIDSIVEDPFGEERDDLDLDRYCQTIRAGAAASLPFASDAHSAAQTVKVITAT
jgi:putative membrane protein